MNPLPIAQAADHLSQIAHAAVDRPEHYAVRLEEAVREMREAMEAK